MKSALTILLFILFAGEVTGFFYNEPLKIVHSLDIEEKAEKVEEKKEEKVYASPYALTRPVKSIHNHYFIHFFIFTMSPVIDHLTPPPDNS